MRRKNRNCIIPERPCGNENIILRRRHEPAQKDRTQEGTGPQAQKKREEYQASGEGSEREIQIG